MKMGDQGFLRNVNASRLGMDRRTRSFNAALSVFYARLLQLASRSQGFENTPSPRRRSYLTNIVDV
ncbi:hypothetical protein B9Q04_15270 [Candidatus Marsarchaeota G2 archaeon BE_D]|jgi:hypothetical protein|uniref:Uncharacterized protein n=1 Tax=Candidatus Marsarchaeota G2 archaeon BE_D TaxID=1978158 RepID=A0A2R6C6S2_9ARCH|nr:MAG: hypothetical protein B9Q04_15270 [Candidatus Marsarchaeota G2 archaeon BE_D]